MIAHVVIRTLSLRRETVTEEDKDGSWNYILTRNWPR